MGLAGLAVVALTGWYLWGLYHFHAAEKALGRYEFQEALSEFESSLRIWPMSASTRVQAARAARRAGQLERADEYLSACEKSFIPTETKVERAMLRAQQGNLVEVENELRGLLLESHRDSVLILESLAAGCIRLHRRRAAVEWLAQLLEKKPDHPVASFWLGNQLAGAGLLADAVPHYQQVLRLAPQRTDCRLKLAEALVGSSQPSEALRHFEMLQQLTPDDPAVLLGAGRCHRALGQRRQAREFLDTLLRDHPDHAEAWAERGRVCREQGDGTEALRCLRKAFELAPNNQKIGFSLLGELRGQQKKENAEELWKRLQHVLQQVNRIRELTMQLNRPGRNAPARYEIGIFHMKNKEEAEAEGWLLGAVQDDPDYQPAHIALADYYHRIGKTAAATYHRGRASMAGQ
jgi:tetratricopeptide (TPR) repeat protein